MKIPKKLLIGDRLYRIKNKLMFVNLFDSDISGNINYNTNIMKIKKVKDNKTEEDIFFHEVTHGILKELEFNHPKIVKFRNDEEFVQEMGLILRKIFLDLMEKQK